MKELLQNNNLLLVFAVAALGYVLGSIKVKGMSLGTAGVLIVALVFGHFGLTAPGIVQDLGLCCFVTAVGFIAGPGFFRSFTGNAAAYVVLGLVIIAAGAATCIGVILVAGVGTDLALGLMAGALTTTPGLAAAMEATGSDLVSLGYGIAYPFGVISVVVFVQVMPRILHVDTEKARMEYQAVNDLPRQSAQVRLFTCDSRGFFGFSLAVMVGVLLGKISIPLPGGAAFSLGTSGGPLLAGLLLGHFGHIGILDVTVKKEVLVTMREFGLAMFLIGAGTKAGVGFVEILMEQGISLFIYGAVMAVVPMLVGYLVASKVFKLGIFNLLGAICGGMTSTPALGTLIEVAGTDDVASAYAATYPVALAAVVLAAQFIGVYM